MIALNNTNNNGFDLLSFTHFFLLNIKNIIIIERLIARTKYNFHCGQSRIYFFFTKKRHYKIILRAKIKLKLKIYYNFTWSKNRTCFYIVFTLIYFLIYFCSRENSVFSLRQFFNFIRILPLNVIDTYQCYFNKNNKLKHLLCFKFIYFVNYEKFNSHHHRQFHCNIHYHLPSQNQFLLCHNSNFYRKGDVLPGYIEVIQASL